MAGFKFKYDDDYYTVQGAEALSMRELRAEYTRMRDVAQKRVARLGKEFATSKAYQRNAMGFPKLRDIDPRDLKKAFADLAKFVRAKGSTVSGQREIQRKTIATWQKQGLNLNPKNYDNAIRILEELRKRKLIYGSDKVVELADAMNTLSSHQTNVWLNHLDQLMQHTDQLQEIPDLSGYTFDEVLDMIGE